MNKEDFEFPEWINEEMVKDIKDAIFDFEQENEDLSVLDDANKSEVRRRNK